LQSGSNIGSICRNALAFNVSEVVVAGKPGSRQKMRGADRGAKALLTINEFPSTSLAGQYLKEEKRCTLIGLEILPQAHSLASFQFPEGNVAFVFGNEGAGLSEGQRRICDQFVYIPQYSKGMASINVACCSAIALNIFAMHAGYQETERAKDLEKFL